MRTWGAAPGAGPGDDVRDPVAGHVPGRDEHAAQERGVIGEEAPHLGPAHPVEDADVRPAPRAGPGDGGRDSIAGDVASRHDRPPGETRPSHRVTLIGEELAPRSRSPRRRRGRAARRRGPRP